MSELGQSNAGEPGFACDCFTRAFISFPKLQLRYLRLSQLELHLFHQHQLESQLPIASFEELGAFPVLKLSCGADF